MFKGILILTVFSLMLNLSSANPVDEPKQKTTLYDHGVEFKSSEGIRYHFPYFESIKTVDSSMIEEFAPPMKEFVSLLQKIISDELKRDGETKALKQISSTFNMKNADEKQMEKVANQIRKLVEKHEKTLSSFIEMAGKVFAKMLDKARKKKRECKISSYKKDCRYLKNEFERHLLGLEELAAISPVSIIFDWDIGSVYGVFAERYYGDLLGELKFTRGYIYDIIVKYVSIILGISSSSFG